MDLLHKINNANKSSATAINELQNQIDLNADNLRKANELLIFASKIRDELSTEFEYLDSFMEDGEISVVFKEWIVELYIDKNDDIEHLENNLDIILPYFNIQVIYIEPNNTLKYYNSQDDLHKSIFYEINENVLKVHVSVRIKKSFDVSAMIIPQAKLHITISSPLNISN